MVYYKYKQMIIFIHFRKQSVKYGLNVFSCCSILYVIQSISVKVKWLRFVSVSICNSHIRSWICTIRHKN